MPQCCPKHRKCPVIRDPPLTCSLTPRQREPARNVAADGFMARTTEIEPPCHVPTKERERRVDQVVNTEPDAPPRGNDPCQLGAPSDLMVVVHRAIIDTALPEEQ